MKSDRVGQTLQEEKVHKTSLLWSDDGKNQNIGCLLHVAREGRGKDRAGQREGPNQRHYNQTCLWWLTLKCVMVTASTHYTKDTFNEPRSLITRSLWKLCQTNAPYATVQSCSAEKGRTQTSEVSVGCSFKVVANKQIPCLSKLGLRQRLKHHYYSPDLENIKHVPKAEMLREDGWTLFQRLGVRWLEMVQLCFYMETTETGKGEWGWMDLWATMRPVTDGRYPYKDRFHIQSPLL